MAYHVVIDESVEGKRVVNEHAEAVGVVTAVRDDTVYVDLNPGIAESFVTKFDWADVEEDDHPLPEESIDRITDDEVHVRSEF